MDYLPTKNTDYAVGLYVVATPIGNLDDITIRAIDTLKNVDVIACEDTRNSRILLNRWNISTPLVSLHRFNENSKIDMILERLKNGQRIALISDAGTPNISDPGYRLVRSVKASGFNVSPIPGPSSIIAALSVSGFDGSSFVFMGFSPKKENALREFFQKISLEKRTVVFMETARRIIKIMDLARKLIPKRELTLTRELTKKFEEIISGDASSLHEQLGQMENIRGEFVVVIGPSKLNLAVNLEQVVRDLMKDGYSGKDLACEAQKRFNVSKSLAYNKFISITRAKVETDCYG